MRISVIVPCFNAARTLESCLTSIVKQTAEVELIVIDGASSDPTEETISPFISQIAHYRSEKDSGVYDAMNKGLDLASGDWIYFLGADDQLTSKNCLEALLADIPDESDLVIGRTHNLAPRHPKVPEWYEPRWNKEIRIRNIAHHQGTAYRKRVFKTYRFPTQFKILADYHLNLSLFYAGAKAEIKDIHVANCASDGLSKNFNTALYLEEWQVKKEVLSYKILWYQPAVLAMKYLRKRLR
ncbi:MAG: glycosyltransferase involved in cell wall biosynthesis [Flavobacteriales bacterium]|jgi:putative colanic acid biosynthesis glycosyltransferase